MDCPHLLRRLPTGSGRGGGKFFPQKAPLCTKGRPLCFHRRREGPPAARPSVRTGVLQLWVRSGLQGPPSRQQVGTVAPSGSLLHVPVPLALQQLRQVQRRQRRRAERKQRPPRLEGVRVRACHPSSSVTSLVPGAAWDKFVQAPGLVASRAACAAPARATGVCGCQWKSSCQSIRLFVGVFISLNS